MPNHSKTVKPAKPHKDFPLFAHANGQWCKKVRGKFQFFGVWRDPDAALARWLAEKDYLIAGRVVPTTPTTPDGPTVRDACNAFLTAKLSRLDSGELSPLSFADYKATCECLIDFFGRDRLLTDLRPEDFQELLSDLRPEDFQELLSDLRPEDFQELRATLAKTRKAVALGNAIQRVRSVFKFAFENDLIDRPIKFGSEFKKPSRKSVRIEHAKSGRGVYEAVEHWKNLPMLTWAEVRQIIAAASPVLQAMLLLGIN